MYRKANRNRFCQSVPLIAILLFLLFSCEIAFHEDLYSLLTKKNVPASPAVIPVLPLAPEPVITPVPASWYQFNLLPVPELSISCALADAEIHYSIDDPVLFYLYSFPFLLPLSANPLDWTVNHVYTIRAWASKDGYTDSGVVTADWQFFAPGTLVTLAGTGSPSFSGDGFAAENATLNGAQGIALDSAGNIYFADTGNHRIRKIDALTGLISTFAGTGTAGYDPLQEGGPATAAMLSGPSSLCTSNTSLYISDTGNNRIRMVSFASNIITTFAGTGASGFSGDGGDCTLAVFNNPTGISFDNNDKNLFIADTGNNCIRKIVISTGIITSIAGDGTNGFSGDGSLATSAALSAPEGVCIKQATKDLFIADTGNNRIRSVDGTSGIITTIAGTGVAGYSGDGGNAIDALLDTPTRMTLNSTGAIFICDTGNNCIRSIDSGVISAFAGTGIPGTSGEKGPATMAELTAPVGIIYSNTGYYIADTGNNRIIKVLKY